MPHADQQFDTFEQWVERAHSWLTCHHDYSDDPRAPFRAICFDNRGRLCRRGADFMRARDEGAFPVHWVWPDQIGPLLLQLNEIAKEFAALQKAVAP